MLIYAKTEYQCVLVKLLINTYFVGGGYYEGIFRYYVANYLFVAMWRTNFTVGQIVHVAPLNCYWHSTRYKT